MLLSQATYYRLSSADGLSSLGTRELDGVDEPVVVWRSDATPVAPEGGARQRELRAKSGVDLSTGATCRLERRADPGNAEAQMRTRSTLTGTVRG